MTFTTESILLIMGALFAGIVTVIRAWRDTQIKDEIAKVQTVAAVIEGHVNSASTASKMREEAAAREKEMLLLTIVDLKKTAELLAQKAGPTKKET